MKIITKFWGQNVIMKTIGKRIKLQIGLKFGKQIQFTPKTVWFDGEKINFTKFLQNNRMPPNSFKIYKKKSP